ncbi:MAG: invasion associated locus B family protein [Hyphomicrobiaceae bacterium]
MSFRSLKSYSLASILVGAVFFSSLSAQAASLIKSFNDWSVFAHEEKPKKICFAASQPKTTLPKGVNRDPIYFYVSAWPNDGIKTEVSIRLGYPVRTKVPVRVTIGNKQFSLFAKGDKAYVSDSTEELKLIDAMKKGSTMTVQATSKRGTRTSDSYSLRGITSALEGLQKNCS